MIKQSGNSVPAFFTVGGAHFPVFVFVWKWVASFEYKTRCISNGVREKTPPWLVLYLNTSVPTLAYIPVQSLITYEENVCNLDYFVPSSWPKIQSDKKNQIFLKSSVRKGLSPGPIYTGGRKEGCCQECPEAGTWFSQCHTLVYWEAVWKPKQLTDLAAAFAEHDFATSPCTWALTGPTPQARAPMSFWLLLCPTPTPNLAVLPSCISATFCAW